MTNRYWTIAEIDLMTMLAQVAAGEDPDVVLAERYANSRIEAVEDDRERPS